MDTPTEVERIRALWGKYTSGPEWLENTEALKALGAEVGLLLAHIDAQQAVIDAARAVGRDVTAANWYEDAHTYIVDAEALETLRDALEGEGAGDGTQSE